ncbi:MAG: tRNA dihydrouridine synthase DusB [Thermoanaerobaculia bacterium]|nr:tRNA dihydrouridine synthase DusB [Thermoanaerobaculia bacterium]
MSDNRTMASPLIIGNVTADPPLLLAPMAGVTDRDFRLIVRRIGGVGIVSMEFLSARGLVENDKRWSQLTHFAEEERPLAIQIYGSDAKTMADAAEIVQELGPDVCDINLGCPANKILRGCAGAALLGDPPLVADIVRQVRRRLTIPLTVKIRLGLDNQRVNHLEIGRICQEEGADAITLHPRTAKEKFTGRARWDHIGELVSALEIPVIGNGDVMKPDDAVRMFRETGCAGVMVARGATRNPWIFAQIAARLDGDAAREPSMAERHRLIREHFLTVIEREEETYAMYKLKTFLGVYSQGLPDSLGLRRSIQGLEGPADFIDAIDRYFARAAVATSRAAADAEDQSHAA